MGRFIYAGSPNDSYRLDDRVLAHLELAIGAKFRLGHSFAFTLEGDDLRAGVGYHMLWMHPSISLQFRYDGDRAAIAVNPGWVGALIGSASSEGGLRLVPEPAGPVMPSARAKGAAKAAGTPSGKSRSASGSKPDEPTSTPAPPPIYG